MIFIPEKYTRVFLFPQAESRGYPSGPPETLIRDF